MSYIHIYLSLPSLLSRFGVNGINPKFQGQSAPLNRVWLKQIRNPRPRPKQAILRGPKPLLQAKK
jgi:hypothetical protein